jgi:hypothetical protein
LPVIGEDGDEAQRRASGALVPAHFELSAVSQVPVLDLGISRAIGLLWSREREHADLKEFIEFAGEHCWAQ